MGTHLFESPLYLRYGEFRVGCHGCSNPRAQNRPIKEMAALQQLHLMTSTYLSEKGLSYLVELMGGQNGGQGAL